MKDEKKFEGKFKYLHTSSAFECMRTYKYPDAVTVKKIKKS